MCTVSFIPFGNSIIITSNRDEHISRPTALEPKEELIGENGVLFPKDPQAGGTWFAVNDKGAVGVLLNGAFVRHQRTGTYVKSRGLVVLDILGSNRPVDTLQDIELYDIEPFTMILYQDDLLEFRWDGNQKYFRPMDKSKCHIWSSSTLYDHDVIEKRELLFNEFIDQSSIIGSSDVINFHSNNHSDQENGFMIDRATGLKTFSVTQVILNEEETRMLHIDLLNDRTYEVPFTNKHLIT